MPKYVVRHGAMRQLSACTTSRGEEYRRGCRVVARTGRGLELGEVLCAASDEVVESLSGQKVGQILREATDEDEHEALKICQLQRSEFEICQERTRQLGMEIKIVDLEHLFGGERVVVYFLAEGRVDFRELVRMLAGEFQTRVEMRQIGVRDEAKLLADYGDCGKPVCCNTHLAEMPPVAMRMAKLQKATLDPNKISGRCGRLKCCLRYEYDTYRDLQRELPPIGADVVTRSGRVRILGQEILAGQLLVQTEDMRRILIDASDVMSVVRAPLTSRSNEESTTSPM